MKLRLHESSVRFRLNRKDVEQLRTTGNLQACLRIQGERELRYGLHALESSAFILCGTGGDLLVGVPASTLQQWLETNLVGIYADVDTLAISIEKDFVCLGVPGEERDPHAFPHPEPSC